MLEKIRDFFKKAWGWVEAVWKKHDDSLELIVQSVLPMVIDLAFRNELSGEQKRKALVDAIVDNAEVAATQISTSMLNEAIELAANRYNIQIGKLTVAQIDNAREAAIKAARDFANGKLSLSGQEAEDAGVVPVSIDNNVGDAS